MEPFDIDPDIARARTLPARVYRDPDIYDRQRERIFARAWHCLPEAGKVKANGHVVPLTLLDGCLDEPLVLTRDEGSSLHCLSNVCTHRGTLVVEGEGHAAMLRCRYHGRRFHLDGRLHSMPGFDGVHGFPSEADNLPRLAMASWGALQFCAIDPAFTFDEWMGPVRDRVGFLPLQSYVFDAASSTDYVIDANWALYVDNYLEEFHIPYVHGNSLADKLDFDAYRTEVFELANLQVGIARPGEECFALPDDHPDTGTPIAAYYFWLFPNLMLNFYPWGLSLNIVKPMGPARTRVSFLRFAAPGAPSPSGVGGDLHRVEMEDEEVVESVQRGVRSRLYDRGRYSPRREVGTHHFHRLMAAFLSSDATRPTAPP